MKKKKYNLLQNVAPNSRASFRYQKQNQNPKRRKVETKAFSKHQPKDGEVVVHCGHLDVAAHHFWSAKINFTRPDYSRGVATWMVACADCYNKAGGSCAHVLIRGDIVWKGNDPIIEEVH